MKLEELLEWAKWAPWTERHAAQAVIDMFGEGSLCGYEVPTWSRVVGEGSARAHAGPLHSWVRVPESWGGALLSASEARALAGQLLRAADEADGGA